VDPFGVAVNVTAVPLVKVPLQVLAHPSPEGELVTIPEPVPAKFTVRFGDPPPPVALKHFTFAVMKPVTIAPDEDIFPMLWFVVMVAEIRVLPQERPVAVARPVELTVTMSGVFEVQVTWAVMSLVTGGCM
jgi:hypothetical protein